MKKRIQNVSFILLLLFIFNSCNNIERYNDQLSKAELMMDTNPQEALSIIQSIPYPEEMDKKNYMLYILLKTQCKYKAYEDITGNSLILSAQHYFEDESDFNHSSLANYYTGAYFYENRKSNEALYYFQKSEKDSKTTSNHLLTAKSLHAIANIYYNEIKFIDKSLSSYKEALQYYKKCKNVSGYEISVMNYIGSIFEETNQLDSALHYHQGSLDLSIKENNVKERITSERLLAIIYLKKKDYNQAKKLFHSALANTQDQEESTRIEMRLTQLYTETNQLDSARLYANLLVEKLPKINYNYTLELAYNILSEYYTHTGNDREALKYKILQQEEERKILHSESANQLLHTQYMSRQELLENKLAQAKQQTKLYSACLVLFFLLLSSFLYYKYHLSRKKNQVLVLEQSALQNKLTRISFINTVYRHISVRWLDVDRKIKQLSAEFGVTEDPPLIQEINSIIHDLNNESKQQLIDYGKNYLLELTYSDKLLSTLSDDDILLLMLYRNNYSREIIHYIMKDSPLKKYLSQIRYYLIKKIESAGIPADPSIVEQQF